MVKMIPREGERKAGKSDVLIFAFNTEMHAQNCNLIISWTLAQSYQLSAATVLLFKHAINT